MKKDIEKIFNDDGFHVIASSPAFPSKADATQDMNSVQQKLLDHMQYLLFNKGEKISVRQKEVPEPGVNQELSHRAEHDVATIVEHLRWHMDQISQKVIGREDVIKQAIFSILTGEHMLLLSRTGMAKSFLAGYIFKIFEGARVFSSQASKDQTPDNYFGPYNIEEFKKGRIHHNIKGSVIEANFVFLDEFFDASDVVLRSLLSVLNERKFINGSEQIDVAVHSAIATANYMRLNEVTEAVLDRFTYKAVLPETTNLYNQLRIDRSYAETKGKIHSPDKKIYFEQVCYLHDIVCNNNKDVVVKVPDMIYFMKNVVVNRYVSEMRKSDYSYFVSPRKQAKLVDFLRASAILNNRFEVTMDDIGEMYNAICTLNSYISVKSAETSEVDVFKNTFQNVMVHYNTTGSLEQVEFLLNAGKILQQVRDNPDGRDEILASPTALEKFWGVFKRIFPGKKKSEEPLTLDSLKNKILSIQPTIEEVRELKDGILRDFRDIR